MGGWLAIVTLAGVAYAEPAAAPGPGDSDAGATDTGAPALSAATALPYAVEARHPRPGVVVISRGGYDGSTGAAVLSAAIEATVLDRVSVHAVVAEDAASPRAHVSGGFLVDVARQGDGGLDLAVGGDYDARGWNRVPAVIARIAAARAFGDLRLVAAAAVGLGTEDGERYGEVQIGALRRITARVGVGFAAHAAIDLERDDDEPTAEPDWELEAGPVATYSVGRIALSAYAGLSSWKLRLQPQTYVGAIGSLGVGVAF